MTDKHPPPNRPKSIETRLKTEARTAFTCLMPRDDDDLRKEMLRLFVIGWFLWTFGIEAWILTRGPAVIGGFTFHTLIGFVVIYTFARLQKLEVERFIPWLDPSGKSGGRQYTDREQEAHDDREEGSTGGFVFSNDRDSDDEK